MRIKLIYSRVLEYSLLVVPSTAAILNFVVLHTAVPR